MPRICVIASSYEGANSAFEEFDEYQDPARYVKDGYEFTMLFVKKATAKEQLDEAVKPSNGYDYYWNFMWGEPEDDVAGLEAIEYLESLNVPIIGTSSRYLKLGKVEAKMAASLANILVPKWMIYTSTPNTDSLKYPVIVKQSRGGGSLFTNENSVCRNREQVEKQVEWLQNQKMLGDIIIEEFIEGREVAVTVIETPDGLIAFPPMEWRIASKDFLHFKNKFQDPVHYDILEEETPLVARIKATACRMYDYLGVRGSGYAVVDIRITASEEIYVLEVNNTPAFFAALGNDFGDDEVIMKTYPGGHKGLVDTIVQAKERIYSLARFFDNVAATSEKSYLVNTGLKEEVTKLSKRYDFSGTVLDLGCETGVFGKLLKQNYAGNCEIDGVELSKGMTEHISPGVYSKVHLGLMENVVMELVMDLKAVYDHVTSFCSLQYLDQVRFDRVFELVFLLARKSVTLIVESISTEYNKNLKEKCKGFVCYNHLSKLDNAPVGWRIVEQRKLHLSACPFTEIEITGTFFRFERI